MCLRQCKYSVQPLPLRLCHVPSESDKISEITTKSSRHGDAALGCGCTIDVRGDDEDCDEDDPSFISAAGLPGFD